MYDRIGVGCAWTRRPDPRLVALIESSLAGADLHAAVGFPLFLVLRTATDGDHDDLLFRRV